MSNEDIYEIIKDSKYINNKNYINNLINYISFIKNKINITDYELKYIIYLTINNKYNKILLNDKKYSKNTNYYDKEFIKMFMYNYNKNIYFLSKLINIRKRNFNQLIKHINLHKKRIYSYFEIINYTNINFYLPIILSMEDSN